MLRCVHGKPEHIEAAYPSNFGGANPPDERKEGDADGYIFGLDPDRYTHCIPDWSVLSDLPGKEIAANYCE